MSLVAFLRHGVRLLVPLAVACTIYLYLFPVFQGCAFPVPSRDPTEAYESTKQLHWPYSLSKSSSERPKVAPFRLLALGDPQLEGDTSIPTNYLGTFPHLKKIYRHVTFKSTHWSFKERVKRTCHDWIEFIFEDIPWFLESMRKRFDLFGNDFYLAHIYRTVHWWSRPTHVSVLGDLVGSQWIDNVEFEKRGRRFWNRSFRGGERVPDDVARYPNSDDIVIAGYLNGSAEEHIWTKRIINVAGNHDIGYAGDLNEERLERFERVFGKAQYDLRFELPVTDPEKKASMHSTENQSSDRLQPELRIVVVNDMNLDTPAKSGPLQDSTYQFINSLIGSANAVDKKGHFTLILTHIPLYKPAGVCVDEPMFAFHTEADGGGLKEQNQLSADASKGFLEGIYGMSAKNTAPGGGLGRPGLMLNGHDHAGCDTYHYMNQTNGTDPSERHWQVERWADAVEQKIPGSEGIPGRREITVRSMMGDFGGNAGLLSMWFDEDTWEWRFEYSTCPLGRQHVWWTVHIADFIILLWVGLYGVLSFQVSRGVDVDAKFNVCVSRVRDWILRKKRGSVGGEVNGVRGEVK